MDQQQIQQQAEDALVADENRRVIAEGTAVGGLLGLVIALGGVLVARLRRRRRSS